MYNNHQNSDQKPAGAGAGAPMSPRISFSNDFVESSSSNNYHSTLYQHHLIKNERSFYRDAPVSSDFEFCSLPNYNNSVTMSADELFSKGRLLPFKDTNNNNINKTTTLKDELLVEDNDDFSLKPPRSSSSSSTRWRGFLGLRKSHIGSKKLDKIEDKRGDEALPTKNSSRDALHGGGSSSSCRETEFRFN